MKYKAKVNINNVIVKNNNIFDKKFHIYEKTWIFYRLLRIPKICHADPSLRTPALEKDARPTVAIVILWVILFHSFNCAFNVYAHSSNFLGFSRFKLTKLVSCLQKWGHI